MAYTEGAERSDEDSEKARDGVCVEGVFGILIATIRKTRSWL